MDLLPNMCSSKGKKMGHVFDKFLFLKKKIRFGKYMAFEINVTCHFCCRMKNLHLLQNRSTVVRDGHITFAILNLEKGNSHTSKDNLGHLFIGTSYMSPFRLY